MKRHVTYKGKNAILETTEYLSNNTLAVIIKDSEDDETYTCITVNLDSRFQDMTSAFVDSNNYPEIGKWLEQLSIAVPTGIVARSGFCSYELYRFNV